MAYCMAYWIPLTEFFNVIPISSLYSYVICHNPCALKFSGIRSAWVSSLRNHSRVSHLLLPHETDRILHAWPSIVTAFENKQLFLCWNVEIKKPQLGYDDRLDGGKQGGVTLTQYQHVPTKHWPSYFSSVTSWKKVFQHKTKNKNKKTAGITSFVLTT